MPHPERFVVGHPFNPVYLLPLVEVVAGEQTSAETVERAVAFYSSVGMKPLRVGAEIDGFVADRLLEALWREALWLVHDGVATVERDRRRDPLRAGPPLGADGDVPDVPHRRRRRRDAALPRAVRAGSAVAVDEADGRAGAHRRARRTDQRAVGRPGGWAVRAGARAPTRRQSGRPAPGSPFARLCGGRGAQHARGAPVCRGCDSGRSRPDATSSPLRDDRRLRRGSTTTGT